MFYKSLIALLCLLAPAAFSQSTNIYSGMKIAAGTTQFTTGTNAVSGGGGAGGSLDTTSLAIYLKMNDAAGTNVLDYSGNGFTGTFPNGLGGGSWHTGYFTFNSFSGTSNPLQVGDETALDSTTAITYEIFFNSTLDNNGSASPGGILGRGYGSGYNLIGAGNAGDVTANLWINGNQTSLTTSGAGFYDGAWHQIAVTWDGGADGKIRIYKDGVLVATSTTGTTGAIAPPVGSPLGVTAYNGAPLTIGSVNDDNQANLYGSVNKYLQYGVAKTGSQIATNYSFLSAQ